MVLGLKHITFGTVIGATIGCQAPRETCPFGAEWGRGRAVSLSVYVKPMPRELQGRRLTFLLTDNVLPLPVSDTEQGASFLLCGLWSFWLLIFKAGTPLLHAPFLPFPTFCETFWARQQKSSPKEMGCQRQGIPYAFLSRPPYPKGGSRIFSALAKESQRPAPTQRLKLFTQL